MSIEPSASSISENPQEGPKFVFIPGLTGGGKGLTALRGIQNLFVPSSISTREAFKKGETVKTHHENLAREISLQTGDRNLYLFGHSLGGLEAVDILSMLVENPNFKSKKVKLVFIGTPGFTSKGIKGLVEFGNRNAKINERVAQNEQHIAYPLPEEYYVKHGSSATNDIGTDIFEDTPEKRVERKRFFTDSLTAEIIPKGKTKETLIEELDKIDNQIRDKIEFSLSIDDLLNIRTKLLAPIIQSFFRGEHINRSHNEMLKKYHELREDLAHNMSYFSSTLLYLARTGKHIFEGTGKQFKQILTKAKQAGIHIDIAFMILERDEMIKTSDIDRIKQNFKEDDIKKVVSFLMMEQLAHSSFGYYPQPLEGYLKTLA